MPVYMEISRLHRTVTIVARGAISAEEIRSMGQRLADAHVRSFAKIIEVAGASTDLTAEQFMKVAEFLRGDPKEQRGPVAFIVDPNHAAFPQAFAKLTRGDGPVKLFKSLREARLWLDRIEHSPTHPLPEGEDHTPWSDPNREGVLLRGEKERGVTRRLAGRLHGVIVAR
jgi:hypothetical protein